jgi:hypothetical protein
MLITLGEGTPSFAMGESDLAGAFPADTQVYLETRELGATIEMGFEQVDEMMEAEGMADDPSGSMSDREMLFGEDSPLTAMLGARLSEFFDFVGDAAMGAGLSSDGLWFGVAAEVTDETVAAERLARVMTVLNMFMMGAEEQGVSVETSMVGDVEVTSIIVPFDEMLAEAGVPIGLGNSIDFALDGDELLIGLGDFVESAILSDGSDSLATDAGYLDAIGEDVPNAGVAYVNIGSLLTAFEPILAMMGPEWAEIAPYANAFDRFVVVASADEGVLHERISVIVSQ